MRRDPGALEARRFDLAVVGGGIHGAAVARDAALRGLAVCLVERDDFGSATSGNSLGILHGGLRDLKALDLPRLRLMAAERRAWLRTAPHLVRPLPVLVPLRRGVGPSRAAFAVALPLYDLLTAGRNAGARADLRISRGRLLGRAETLARVPWLDPSGLEGAALFHDARMVDPDRLTLAVVRGAAEAGAVVANRVEAVDLVVEDGCVAGLGTRDRLSGTTLRVRARAVVNAAGPWAGALAAGGRVTGPLALAMNVVVRRPLLPGGLAVGLPGDGGRLHFLAPWSDGAVAVGTGYWRHGGADGPVRPDADLVARFLDEIGPALGGVPLGEAEVTRVLAGLLPCDPGGAEPVRHPRLVDHARRGGPAGLLSVVGVKYTTARAVAERAVDLALLHVGRRARPAGTATTLLPGGGPVPALDGAPPALAARLASRYGAAWPEVAALAAEAPDLALPLAAGTPVLSAEVAYAVRHEMALTLADVAIRRTGLAAAGWPGEAAAAAAARVAARELGWDATRTSREVAALRDALGGWRRSPAPA